MDSGRHRSRIQFLGLNHPGPIEAVHDFTLEDSVLHFWDGNIPAPLKLNNLHGTDTTGTFLGWKHPGPIEACPRRRHPPPLPYFWDGNIPAPLKPSLERLKAEMDLRFLGWKHPGPIEASIVGCHQHSIGHFWDGNIPAPLKRQYHERPNVLRGISGMETSRPH